MDNLISASE